MEYPVCTYVLPKFSSPALLVRGSGAESHRHCMDGWTWLSVSYIGRLLNSGRQDDIESAHRHFTLMNEITCKQTSFPIRPHKYF
jgi:hypothetical protein